MTVEWMLDELAHAGPEHLDAAYVAGYDLKAGTDPGDDLDILRTSGVGAGATVVDIGAGTGGLSLAVAPYVARVVAVDVSPAMLDLVRTRVADTGLRNVECVRAGFLSYRHHGAPADVVYTRHAMHQLPDFWKTIALHRIAQVLKPRGILRLRDLIFDFQPDEATGVLDAWLAGAPRRPAPHYTREDYAEHLRTEYSTYRWLFEPMLTAAGFEIVDVAFSRRIYGAYTCVRR